MTRFWREFLRPYRWRLWAIGFLMVAGVGLQLPVPLLTMSIIDTAVKARRLDLIDQLALAMGALIITRHLFVYLAETATLHLRETVILDVESSLIRHLHGLPLGFFNHHHSIYLQSRVMSDSRAIEGALVRTVITLLMDGLTFVVGAAIILVIKREIGVVLLLALLPYGFVRFYANSRMRQLSRDMQEGQATASAIVSEGFSGIRTLKVFGGEVFHQNLTVLRLRGLRDIYVRTNWIGVVSGVVTSLITSLCIAFVLWYGLRGVLAGALSLGAVVGVLSLLNFLFAPINSFVSSNLSLQQAAAALGRIYEFLLEPQEDSTGAVLAPVRGQIELRDVSFSYGPGPPVLRQVSLTVNPGETIALVGRSGAGKSTLVNLLLGFYRPDSGAVLLDGRDLRQVNLRSLRAAVTVVDQQTFLFSGTVADNIRLARPQAGEAEIIEAARRSHAHAFIADLPKGYETEVGERGARLSAGQCQRIALARAFLVNPAVLILDEAVSAVDSESEGHIQEAMRELSNGRTTILIAHRLSSLANAKRVVLLEEGRCIEEGGHAELLASGGAYARLFRQQFQPVADIDEYGPKVALCNLDERGRNDENEENDRNRELETLPARRIG